MLLYEQLFLNGLLGEKFLISLLQDKDFDPIVAFGSSKILFC
jgi:hypothetical protein